MKSRVSMFKLEVAMSVTTRLRSWSTKLRWMDLRLGKRLKSEERRMRVGSTIERLVRRVLVMERKRLQERDGDSR